MINNLVKTAIGLCLSLYAFNSNNLYSAQQEYSILGKAAINYDMNSEIPDNRERQFDSMVDDNYIECEYSVLKEYAINNSDKEIISTPNVNISDDNVTWLEQSKWLATCVIYI